MTYTPKEFLLLEIMSKTWTRQGIRPLMPGAALIKQEVMLQLILFSMRNFLGGDLSI